VNDAALHPRRPRRWALPSIGAVIWITLFLGLNLTSARIVLISADSDPAWHRRLGEWMIQHRAIIREYDFVHTVRGPLVTRDWLSEVVYAGAAHWLGWGGFVLVAAILIATCFWLLHAQLLGEGCDPILATALVLVAMLACSMHWLARPLLFTHLLALVFAWQLRWFQLGRISARRMFLLLPPLMALWANLHGAFLIGLVLIAMHATGSAIDAWRHSAPPASPRVLAALLLICTGASLANPNGWRLHEEILGFFKSAELSAVTTEFGSPNFHTVGMRGFAVLLLLLAVALLIVRPRLDATDVLLVGGWGYFALSSARNVPVFALVVTPLLAQWINEFLQTNHPSWSAHWRRDTTLRVQAGAQHTVNVAAIAAVVAGVVLVLAKPSMAGGQPLIATDFPPDRYPTAMVNYLRTHPQAVHGEMFNEFLWGSYFEFFLPERRPFIDSHNDLYGIGLWREFCIANDPRPGWEAVFAKYHVGWTILPVQHPLNRILELNPQWALVYSGREAMVFSRQS
jgi:hypothetical protein